MNRWDPHLYSLNQNFYIIKAKDIKKNIEKCQIIEKDPLSQSSELLK